MNANQKEVPSFNCWKGYSKMTRTQITSGEARHFLGLGLIMETSDGYQTEFNTDWETFMGKLSELRKG